MKLVFVCRRRENLSRTSYVERLLAGHVPLALRHHPTMRRYVVNVVEDETAAHDSIGELWFDSLDDYRERLYDSPEGERIIAADVRTFLGAAEAYLTEERIHRAPPRGTLGERTAGVKLLVGIERAEGLSPTAFESAWHERHVPIVLACAEVAGYATSRVDQTLSPGAPPFDGFAELWFASPADFVQHVARAREPNEPMAKDVAGLVRRATALRVAEFVQR
ncbi:MAG: EthD family reductase [Candidatus Binatia bacterium]